MTVLTPGQSLALDELISAIPKEKPVQPDWLKTWLGLSRDDLKFGFQALLSLVDGYEGKMLDWIEAHPLDSTLEFLAVASWAFYQAEKGVNPKINTFIDALYYITTCASVGYADIFAVTQKGRAIASLPDGCLGRGPPVAMARVILY